ncbi:MAG: M15 family metallopeptidase [Oscillospiraceae bacterium]|nr:M15 family metallopeptidase [Oscillospiraceae bacterium]
MKSKIWIFNIVFVVVIVAVVFLIVNVSGKSKAIDPPQQDGEAQPLGGIQEELDNYDNWAFYLINKENPLPEDFTVNLAKISEGLFIDERAAPYAIKMIENARADGIILNVISAYRDIEKQTQNFENYVNHLVAEGFSRDEAIAITSTQIAFPGASEHNAGLAIDILTLDWWDTNNSINDVFDQTEEFRWLVRNSWKYGFVLRYPKGKEEITGFDYEPWHFRFVGTFRAEQMYYSNLCLEEYMDLISR